MRVLLTGASGFLGQNLLPVLEADSRIGKVYSSASSNYDLRIPSDCEALVRICRPDVVIHAAGSVGGIGANKNSPASFMYDNLIMGTNIVEQSRVMEVSKLIMLGTVCSYPKHTEVPFKESDLWEGYPEETNAPYGIAKKALMQLVMSYSQQYGMRGVNLVPVNMYGPHDHFNVTSSHVIPAIIVKIHRAIVTKESSITLWGTGQASREFLYAPDCAQAILASVFADIDASPINIGTGQEIKICDLVAMLADIMGYGGEIKYDTSMPDGQPRRCLDVSRAKELLGFTATTDLYRGLVQTVSWWRNSYEQA